MNNFLCQTIRFPKILTAVAEMNDIRLNCWKSLDDARRDSLTFTCSVGMSSKLFIPIISGRWLRCFYYEINVASQSCIAKVHFKKRAIGVSHGRLGDLASSTLRASHASRSRLYGDDLLTGILFFPDALNESKSHLYQFKRLSTKIVELPTHGHLRALTVISIS